MPDLTLAYNWAVRKCNSPTVGYSQTYREGQFHNGIEYYDCSSFIFYALKAGGFSVSTVFGATAWTTDVMCSYLPKLNFKEIPVSSNWQAGDILWRSGHTEFVYSGRRTMGAHTNTVPLADQVSINQGDSSPSGWERLFRYSGGEVTGVGASAYVAAAICGNWMQESTLNPGQWELGYKQGFGLGQWTDNAETTRRTQLLNWLSAHGYQSNDGDGQLAYFIEENVWYRSGVAADFQSLSHFLQSGSTDLSYLTEAFMRGWEGISDSSLSYRISCAQTYLQYFLTHGSDTPGAWFDEENYDSPASTLLGFGSEKNLNNALLIYQFLSGGSPVPPVRGKNKMPFWMMTLRRC